MQRLSWAKSAGFIFLAGTLLLGGCASTDDVKRAQATADQALQLAQTANQKADSAISAANAAGSRADAAMSAANAASSKADAVNEKVDRMFAQSLKK